MIDFPSPVDASLIVDPINIDITLGGTSMRIHNSHIALSVELGSSGVFSATVAELISGPDASALKPKISIPLDAEVMFEIEVASVKVSPILSLSSENLIGEDSINFDIDLGLETFLDEASFGADAALGTVFAKVTDLMGNISTYAPELNVGTSTP
eukprot:11823665-Ditylum_brightwellii.AAC.1